MYDKKLDGAKILLVEDELTFQALMTIAFTEEGATVETADDAAEALRIVRSFKPDLLISDISLPENDGFWLRRQITLTEGVDSPPSIALTGYSGKEAELAIKEAGFDVYLGKPVDLDLLIETAIRLVKQSPASLSA